MFFIRKSTLLSNSRTTLTSALRKVHFRPAPPLKETKATETSSSQGLVVDDFVVHSPARNHVRDYKTETKDQSYLMPHAVYSPKEVLDLKTDVHYTPKVSTKEKYYHWFELLLHYYFLDILTTLNNSSTLFIHSEFSRSISACINQSCS